MGVTLCDGARGVTALVQGRIGRSVTGTGTKNKAAGVGETGEESLPKRRASGGGDGRECPGTRAAPRLVGGRRWGGAPTTAADRRTGGAGVLYTARLTGTAASLSYGRDTGERKS